MRALAFLCALVLATPAYSQQAAEVKLTDGSSIRLKIMVDTLKVAHKHGILEIPAQDIRRIDFGIHVDPDIKKEIDANIKRLGSDVYKERDQATKALTDRGHLSLPALRKVKTSDQEVMARVSGIVKTIHEKTPPELTRLTDVDIIRTTDDTIKGVIDASFFKAHSEHFGELTLKLVYVRTLLVRTSSNAEVSIDATKHGSDLSSWLETDTFVESGQKLTITANGQVDLWPQGPGQYVANPKGYNTAGKGGQFMAGALIGRIGENGKQFFIGERYEGPANDEGKLYLQIVPSPWNNPSSGKYEVRIDNR